VRHFKNSSGVPAPVRMCQAFCFVGLSATQQHWSCLLPPDPAILSNAATLHHLTGYQLSTATIDRPKMDALIDLSDKSKALDLASIRYQLM